jgi:hypothetical protein
MNMASKETHNFYVWHQRKKKTKVKNSSETNPLQPFFRQRRVEAVGAGTRMENGKWEKKMICCI